MGNQGTGGGDGNMKRILSITAQWLFIAALAAGIVYSVIQPAPPQDYNPQLWRSWRGFITISYAGVGSKASGRYASSDTLTDHLDALTAAGYKTITPDDAADYLAGERPLPDKAILLLFESGRKDSFIRATPLLRQRGMRATMCVPTKTTRRWGRFYLKESEIAKAARMSEWTFASMGHQAAEGRFTVRRLEVDGEPEADSAFDHRIRDDYFTAAQILENAAGRPATAYLHPTTQRGAGAQLDPMAARSNSQAVRRSHRIAFARTDDAFNDRHRDPYDLGYIQVRGEWSGAELVREIEQFLPVSLSGRELLKPELWSLTDGARFHESRLAVGNGALAWLRGTIPWTDVDVTARIELRTEKTVPALYVRHTGPDSFLRVTLSTRGARLQEAAVGRLQTLKWHEIPIPVDVPQEIRLRAKGNRFWVWLNGKPVGEALPLANSTKVGRIGVGSQGGAALVAHIEARALPGVFAVVDSLDSIPAPRLASLRTILPNWFEHDGAATVTDALREDLLNAARVGIATVPVVRASRGAAPGQTARFAEQIDAALAHPVYRTLIDRLAVVAPADGLATSLKGLGWNIIHVIDADQVEDWPERPHEGDMLLLHGEQESVRKALNRVLRTCPAERIAVALPDSHELPAGAQRAAVIQPTAKEARP